MGLSALVYPVRDYTFLEEISSRSHEYEHQRLKVLLKLLDGACDVAIACVDAACQLTVPRQVLRDTVIDFAEGTEIPIDKAVRALTLLGYERFDAVDGSGQFSLRGGILDFFMPDSEYPVRAEFWGDEICDLSYFDPETQRRFKKAGEIRLTPSTEIIIDDRAALADKITRQAGLLRGKAAAKARERLYGEAERLRGGAVPANADKFIGQLYEKPECLLDYIARDSLLFVSEFSNVRERGKATDFQNAEQLKQALADGVLAKGCDRYALTFGECMERFTAQLCARQHPAAAQRGHQLFCQAAQPVERLLQAAHRGSARSLPRRQQRRGACRHPKGGKEPRREPAKRRLSGGIHRELAACGKGSHLCDAGCAQRGL